MNRNYQTHSLLTVLEVSTGLRTMVITKGVTMYLKYKTEECKNEIL